MEVLAGIAGKELVKTVVKTSLDSIVKLIKYEWALEDTVQKGLTSLKSELIFMQACIENVSSGPQDQINSVDKIWLTEVKELSCTIEIGLRSFLSSIEPTKGTLLSAANKHYINHAIDSFIQEKLTKAKEVSERRGRYGFSSSQTTSAQEMGARISALFRKESDLVGLDGATNKIIQMLSNHDHVSIVGMGGIGKTTLARAVYGKLAMKQKFDFWAFVPVGQNANVNKVLTDILDDLSIQISGHAPDTRKLINQLRASLEGKRCLFVIDDIWDDDIWDMIKLAFVGSPESRYITTTRKAEVAKPEVAKSDDVVYRMKSLSDADSKKLLQTRLFGAEAKINVPEFSRLSDKILSKCSGVPLAIVAIARLLAKKPREEWSKVYDSIGFSEHEGGVEKDIWRILSFSYSDLPYHLQKCFLYLSLFPEGHWIEKNMLIWRWVAEGLVTVSNEQNLGLFQLGEIYFNELIDRSMILRAVSPRDLGQGGCRVHKMMFDLIRRLSSNENENFSTVIGTKWESTSQTSTIHRLAIHKTRVDESQNTCPLPKKSPNTSLEVGEVLSFYASKCPGSSLPPISKFRGLRVIDLEGCDLSDGDHKLEHLAKLRELVYLGLLGTPVAELPKEIGLLEFLQTLDVTGTSINELPPFVEKLKKLRCLRAGEDTTMKGRVGELTSLEELWLHSVDESPDFAAQLRKLTQLRVLVVHFDEMDQATGNVLVESLSDLTKLQVLQIWSDDMEEKVYFSSWGDSMPSKELRQLLLFGVILPKTTRWIHSCDKKISKLLLQVETLEAVHLEIIGLMPLLLSLYLHSEDNRLSYTAGKDEFKVLEYLYTNIELVCGDGGLPRIQELEVAGIRVGTDVGLRGNNMPLLERATYHLDCKDYHDAGTVQKAEEALVTASQAHPNRPTLSIKRFNNVRLEMEIQRQRLWREGNEDLNSVMTSLISSDDSLNQLIAGLEAMRPPPTLEACTGSPSPIIQVSSDRMPDDYISNQLEIDPVEINKSVLKFMENPEVAACMENVANKPNNEACRQLFKECSQVWISTVEQYLYQKTPPMLQALDVGVSPAFTSTQLERNDKIDEINPERMLASFDRSIATGDISLPPIIASLMSADEFRKLFQKSLQNPELLDSIKSLARNKGGPQNRSVMAKMVGLIMAPDLWSSMVQKLNGQIFGEGTNCSDVPSSMSADNSGARVSCEPLPEIDTKTALSRLNSPEGVALKSGLAAQTGMSPAFISRITDHLVHKPEFIAGMNSTMQNKDLSGLLQLTAQLMGPEIIDSVAECYRPSNAGGGQADASGLPSGLFSNPAFANLMAGLTAQPVFMDPVASVASVVQGVGAPPQGSQEGENFSRMLKELLPAVQQRIHADGASTEQPSSRQLDNVGLEEGAPSKRH